MRTLPGVIATYIRSDSGDRYVLDCASTRTRMSFSERLWWAMHGQYLVNTMAWKGSADVVGLLADRTSYGVYGDHGGAQRSVQRIPMIVYNPSIRHMVSPYGMKLADITPDRAQRSATSSRRRRSTAAPSGCRSATTDWAEGTLQTHVKGRGRGSAPAPCLVRMLGGAMPRDERRGRRRRRRWCGRATRAAA